MRITTETLLKIARDTVEQRKRSQRDLLAAYLHGSLLTEDPLLGGTGDIDLVFVHNDTLEAPREIIRLNDDVHLDIAHHLRNDYRQARSLRVHPWLGPTIINARILYDPQHFMDFTQASVGGQFNRPDNVMSRASGQAEHARQIWQELHDTHPEANAAALSLYLKAIEHAVNALASLNGPPLTERRLLLTFPARAAALGKPGLYPGLLGLLGGPNYARLAETPFLEAWQAAYLSLPAEQAGARLHPVRAAYYRKGMEKLIESGQPHNALWPLLRTWTHVAALHAHGSDAVTRWQEAVGLLGLGGDGFAERLAGLDAYLDSIEETLDAWAQRAGA